MKKSKFYISIIFISLLSLTFLLYLGGCSDEKNHSNSAEANEYWTCTMHPQVISDKPGNCPICQMELVKKSKSNESNDTLQMEGMLNLSQGKLALAGVELAKVQHHSMDNTIKSFSYLDFIEGKREVISARVSGRIEKLYIKNTGEFINKGAPVFEIYSPTLVEAQNDFLIAIENANSNYSLLNNNSNKLTNPAKVINAARKKLELLGLTQKQILKLEQEKEIQYTLTYYSPVSGIIIEKNIQNGIYVNEGSKLFEIGDLSNLWNIADVFEKDIHNVKVGSKVKITLRSFPGETFDGVVTLIYPMVNSQTRTIKVRSEIVNKGNKLKPQMYGETTFELGSSAGLFIPETAVLQTGKRNIVWLRTDDGMFESREVKIGSKFNNMYQVIEGLKENDEVVAKGAYLVDSESQLQTGNSPSHQHGTESQNYMPNREKNNSKNKNIQEHTNH